MRYIVRRLPMDGEVGGCSHFVGMYTDLYIAHAAIEQLTMDGTYRHTDFMIQEVEDESSQG